MIRPPSNFDTTFVNASDGILQASSGGTLEVQVAAFRVANQGVIRALDGSQVVFTGTGGTGVSGGTLATAGSGIIRVPAGVEVYLDGGVKNTGVFVVDATGGLRTFDTFTNSGAVRLGAGVAFTANGPVLQTGGALSLGTGATISAANGLSIQGGRLDGSGTVTGNVSVAGTIAPGFSAGLFTINGDLSLADSAALEIEIGGLVPGTGHDQLTEGGSLALTLRGLLNVRFINGFQGAITGADAFVVVTSNAAILGGFLNVAGGRVFTADGLGSFAVGLGPGGTDVVLSDFRAIPEPGAPSSRWRWAPPRLWSWQEGGAGPLGKGDRAPG